MKYRLLGKLDVEVSVVGMGAAAISGEGGGYGFGHISEEDSLALVHAAQDKGINLFDTAPIYGFGMSERRLGKALSGERRERAFIVSKSGITWDDQKNVQLDNSPATTEKMLHQSLRDLQTEYIDLYLVHWPDENTDIRRTVEVLVSARDQGKIKAFGLSNTNPDELALASEIAQPQVLQAQMNLFENEPVESLFPSVRTNNMGFMSWGTLDKGILTGRVHQERKFDDVDVRSHAPWWTSVDHTPRYEAMKTITPLIQEAGHTGLELALSHVLEHQETSTALCGMRNMSQLETACAAADNLLSTELLNQVRTTANQHTTAA